MSLTRAVKDELPTLVNPITGTTIGVAYNQQNIGTTIRPAATSLLTIDSEDRFSSYIQKRQTQKGSYNWSPYDFTISKPESIMTGFFTRLAVTEVVFPTGVLPNVNASRNFMTGSYVVGIGTPVPFNVILQDGFYTPAALAAAIQAVVRTATGLTTFTMSYGTLITGTPSPQFEYDVNVVNTAIRFQPVPYNTTSYPFPPSTKQLFDMLGFSSTNENYAPGGYSGVTYCEGTRYVDIVCSQLVYNQSLKDTSSQSIVRDSLCRVYLVPNAYENTLQATDPKFAPPGTIPTIIYRNFTTPKQIAWSPNQPVGQLSFQVYDDDGALIKPDTITYGQNQNNMEWSMTLQVTEN